MLLRLEAWCFIYNFYRPLLEIIAIFVVLCKVKGKETHEISACGDIPSATLGGRTQTAIHTREKGRGVFSV